MSQLFQHFTDDQQTIRIYRQDVGMEFVIEIYAVLIMRNGDREQ